MSKKFFTILVLSVAVVSQVVRPQSALAMKQDEDGKNGNRVIGKLSPKTTKFFENFSGGTDPQRDNLKEQPSILNKPSIPFNLQKNPKNIITSKGNKENEHKGCKNSQTKSTLIIEKKDGEEVGIWKQLWNIGENIGEIIWIPFKEYFSPQPKKHNLKDKTTKSSIHSDLKESFKDTIASTEEIAKSIKPLQPNTIINPRREKVIEEIRRAKNSPKNSQIAPTVVRGQSHTITTNNKPPVVRTTSSNLVQTQTNKKTKIDGHLPRGPFWTCSEHRRDLYYRLPKGTHAPYVRAWRCAEECKKSKEVYEEACELAKVPQNIRIWAWEDYTLTFKSQKNDPKIVKKLSFLKNKTHTPQKQNTKNIDSESENSNSINGLNSVSTKSISSRSQENTEKKDDSGGGTTRGVQQSLTSCSSTPSDLEEDSEEGPGTRSVQDKNLTSSYSASSNSENNK